jgi:putative endonuclease
VEKSPAVYILANRPYGVLYVGVTSHLHSRIFQHKEKLAAGFTARYNVDRLVYYELFEDMYSAISRERQLKAGPRRRKIRLIEDMNPGWHDLYDQIYDW